MRRYTQLTRGKRYQIRALLKAGNSQSKVAFYLKVHKSTISREIRRNRGHKGYRPRQAHEKAMARRCQAAKRIKMSPAMIILVSHYISQDFSPEQVSGYLARNHGLKISHETIYKYIWSDKRNGGCLYKHLRHSKRKYKKRYGTKERRGRMKGQVSIELRPAVVEAKSRIGDWEMDTITGKNSTGYILSVVERKSKLTLIKRVADRQADQMAKAVVKLLRPYKDSIFTITVDNGKEFARHKKISKSLKADIYFAHPYHAWERGLNENTNGLLRQYFPKKIDFRTIDDDSIEHAMERLNNRPRKTLGYATPNEVFSKDINNKKDIVALIV
jgi:IS30 family transposase